MPPKSRVDQFHRDGYVTFKGKTHDPSTWYDYVTGTWIGQGTNSLEISQGNPYHLLGDVPHDIGGAFAVTRRISTSTGGVHHNSTTTNDNNPFAPHYIGKYYALRKEPVDADFAVVPHLDDVAINQAGATAIARVIPTNPLVDGLVFLGELRQGFPRLIGIHSLKNRVSFFKSLGGEYLNVEYGWKPFVSDLRKAARIVLDYEQYVENYEKHSGVWSHRRYDYPPILDTTKASATGKYPDPAYQVGYWIGTATRDLITQTREEIWFTGDFCYYLPKLDRGSRSRSRSVAAKLLGLRLTPEVLWDLTPWSWAADWFANTGDQLHNLSAFANDGLIMRHAYVMRKKSIKKTYRTYNIRMKYSGEYLDLTQTFETISKTRAKATPFGFGLNPLTFTVRQWAITTALGLSRAHGDASHF